MSNLPPDDTLNAENPAQKSENPPDSAEKSAEKSAGDKNSDIKNGADKTLAATTPETTTTTIDHYETKDEAEAAAQQKLADSADASPGISDASGSSDAAATAPTAQGLPQPQKTRRFRKLYLVQAALLAMIVVAVMFVLPGGYESEKTLVFPSGRSLSQMSNDLGREQVIRSEFLFKLVLHLPCVVSFGRYCPEYYMKAGEYRFAPRLSMLAVARQMLRGEVVLHQITIPEGLRVVDVVDLVDKQAFLAGGIAPPLPPEGSLLPESYGAERGEPRSLVLRRMYDAMNVQLTKIWAERDLTLPLRTPLELVTLASIVERETALPEERPRVAAVYLNRLRRGMRLQADPTVVYAIGLANPQKPLRKTLFTKDLLKPSPYNTYLNYGLPPGPIANPGVQSLLAVAHPMQSTELYFVANGHGGHNFASTLIDHNRNVLAWKRLQAR